MQLEGGVMRDLNSLSIISKKVSEKSSLLEQKWAKEIIFRGLLIFRATPALYSFHELSALLLLLLCFNFIRQPLVFAVIFALIPE